MKKDTIGEYTKTLDPDGELKSFGFYWYLRARELDRAGEILFIQLQKDLKLLEHQYATGTIEYGKLAVPDLQHTYIMLIGFSIENLLKAMLLHLNPQLIKGSELTGYHFKTHDLVDIARTCKYQLSEDESQLCKLASFHIHWFGRYPMPKKKKDGVQSVHTNIYAIRDTYTHLYGRLVPYLELNKMLNKPRDKG